MSNYIENVEIKELGRIIINGVHFNVKNMTINLKLKENK